MKGLPVILNLVGRRCLIVGGGPVAVRRARSLAECGAHVVMVAPHVSSEFVPDGVDIQLRKYDPSDVADTFLVVIATDDHELNESIADYALKAGTLVNRADAPECSDLQVPAVGQAGDVTIAVHTGNISARAAAAIRDEVMTSLSDDWAKLLELAAPVRKEIQEAIDDVALRQNLLRRLADEEAISCFRQGGTDALKEHYRKILQSAAL